MQEEVQDQRMLVPWTDCVTNSYSDLPLDDSARDLLSSPSESPIHPQHHLAHLHHRQQHHNPEHPQLHYAPQPQTQYNALPEAHLVGHYDYVGSDGVPVLLAAQPRSDMRSGPGARGGGRVSEGLTVRKGWKRKKEDKGDESSRPPNKLESTQRCDVCGEQASGHYFGALVCLPCKSFFIRCTKDGRPNFSNQCGGKCDVLKGGRVRCQHCRFQKCISAGMYRKEKPEAVEPAEGQLLCKVCGDIANGVHFGVTTCEGCKKFFRRGLKENKSYTCKSSMHCSINPRMRNNCRYCRYQKCLHEGMSREAIKMGRPKKGEIPYRKAAKKNGVKDLTKTYDKPASGSNRSSMSSEYDQDDMSNSGDAAFDNVQPQQIHQGQAMQQPLPQQHQQPGAFSLGSLLHDCITVQDWDQKVDMTGLEPGSHRSSSLSVTPSSGPVDINENVTTEARQISPHIRSSAPSMHPEMVNLHHHQNQRIHPQQLEAHQMHLHHLQSQQQIEEMDQLPREAHHQMSSFQEHNQNSENYQVMPGLDFANEHELSDNRAIKVENASLQDNAGGSFSDTVVLENMQNLQGLKSEYHPYQIHPESNAAYSLAEQRAASALANCTTELPTSQPETSSQLVAINMFSQNIIYTPQGQELIIIHNMNQPQTSGNLLSHQIGQNHSNMDHALDQADQELSHSHIHQGMEDNQGMVSHVTRSNAISQIVVGGANYHVMPRGSDMYDDINDLQHQQYVSESNSVESPGHIPSPRVRQLNEDVQETKYTVLSSKGYHSEISPPNALLSSKSANCRVKLQGIRSPIAAILQQHRDAIQAGRPVQLSPEEIEELLNTVNADQSRGNQRFISNQQLLNRREAMNEDNIDSQQHSIHTYSVSDGRQREDDQSDQFNHNADDKHFLNKSPYQNVQPYPSGIPLNQGIVHARQFENQSSDSSSSDIQELQRNTYSNNNNNNQISHYLPHNHTDQHGQGAEQDPYDPYDDSFNSSLFRDSTLLHEINRIFLAIDNSCNTYGCNRNGAGNDQSRTDDGSIYSLLSPDDYSPEISHNYWHGFHQNGQSVPMTAEREKIIKEVLDAFDNLQKTYVTNEPEYIGKKIPQDQLEHWHHIQRRIARHVVAGQRFCRNIPGYFRLDIQDRISLGKHVGFGLMVLIACTEFYDPEYRRFKYIWNWTMPMQNPLYSYKLHLLSLGDRIHDIEMDRTEASMICAISMTSIDCPGLLQPDIVCVVRDVLIDALEAHISTKTESQQRLQKLLSIMPQVRLMTVWYNNLMKKMSVPSDLINSKNSKLQPLEAVGNEKKF